jgi:hypothetical protein
MARFCMVGRSNLSLYAIFQLKFRRREVCLFFAAAVSISVLAGQRVAQGSQAKLCRGQARPQNHNKLTNGFCSNRLLRQERLRKSADSCKLGRRRLRQARPMVGWVVESKQTVFDCPWQLSFFKRGSCVF